MLGVSCCQGDEFAEAVAFVESHGARARAPDHAGVPAGAGRPRRSEFAMENPAEAMKVVIGDIR